MGRLAGTFAQGRMESWNQRYEMALMGFGVPRLGPYDPDNTAKTRKQEQKVGMGQWEWENK